MQTFKNVRGSKDLAVPLIVQKTTVYVKTNIHPVNDEECPNLYEWDEVQYTKDEYIEFMQSEIQNLHNRDIDNKLAIAKIYEMVVPQNG